MQSHEHFMQRALELASRGSGCTSPNPLVGCVVVRNGHIVGEGWHRVYGHEHAELNALNDALDNIQSTSNQPLVDATLYVTLEPCNHHGLTPPCTQAILDAGISRVVYALADPNPKAAGGARYLKDNGVDVIHGVLEDKARFQNRFFLSHVARKRPYVIVKTATSLDGRTATHAGDSQWITGAQSRQRAHQLRQAVDAIIVGANTVVSDNPSLTTRLPEEVCAADDIRHPRPVIMDSSGRVPLDSQLLDVNRMHCRTIVATTPAMDTGHRQLLESRGVDVICVESAGNGSGVDPLALLEALAQRGIHSVLLEGGAKVHGSFRDADLIDELWAFVAPIVIGGSEAPASFAASGSKTLGDATQLDDIRLETLGQDVLVRGLVRADQSEQESRLSSTDTIAGSRSGSGST